MAAAARRHGIAVEVAPFETWEDGGRTYDLVTCSDALALWLRYGDRHLRHRRGPLRDCRQGGKVHADLLRVQSPTPVTSGIITPVARPRS